MSEATLDARALAVLRAELDVDERVQWLTRPLAGRAARESAVAWVVAVPWTAFALFMMFVLRRAGAEPLIAVPFVLYGVVLLASPLWSALGAKRTLYAITDRRAVTIVPTSVLPVGRSGLRSWSPSQLRAIERTGEESSGSGSLVFETTTRMRKGRPRRTPHGFLGIPDVKGAEAVLQRALLSP